MLGNIKKGKLTKIIEERIEVNSRCIVIYTLTRTSEIAHPPRASRTRRTPECIISLTPSVPLQEFEEGLASGQSVIIFCDNVDDRQLHARYPTNLIGHGSVLANRNGLCARRIGG